MKNRFTFLVLLICCCVLLVSCGGNSPSAGAMAPQNNDILEENVDYAASVKLDMTTDTAKQIVTVKTFIDGDTTHFYVPDQVMENGVLKARYLAVNTPESTGKIEEYGKKAASFTKEKLSAATSILVESETASWDPDSTGSRYLVWVWYKTAENEEYRNLNIEILQNGLAIANSAANNRYGATCTAAIAQAKAQKLNIYSGEKDPDFYYGEAIELTLKELRLNVENYNGMKVAFTGVVTSNSGTQGVYVEDYDAESNLYYGMYIYYGHGLTGEGLDVLTVGNKARIVGTVQYYEGGGTWQVSDLSYRLMKPNDPSNVQKISDGNEPAYVPTDPKSFVSDTVTVERNDSLMDVPYASVVMGTSVEMRNLKVVEIFTTTNEDSSSKGAMTIHCDANGTPITVRTAVLLDDNGSLITEDFYMGKTLNVRGIVDYFDGTYQIKVFTHKNIEIIN